MSAPLKTLREHLGECDRAEGFEEWTKESLEAQRLLELQNDPWRAMFARLMQTMSVAGVEAVKREDDLGADYAQICYALAQAMGFVSMSAALSGMKDNVPAPVLRGMALGFSKTFKEAAMLAVGNLLVDEGKGQIEVLEEPVGAAEREAETKWRAGQFYHAVRRQVMADNPGATPANGNEAALGAAMLCVTIAAQAHDETVRPLHAMAAILSSMTPAGDLDEARRQWIRAFDDMAAAHPAKYPEVKH